MRRTFERHGAAAVFIGGFDLFAGKAEFAKQIEIPVVRFIFGEAEGVGQEFFAERIAIEGKGDIEDVAQGWLRSYPVPPRRNLWPSAIRG